MQNKNLLKKIPLLVAILMIVVLIAGCDIGGAKLPDLSERYTVIYDGNGGVLGNKTFTTRKLLVKPGSKIPRYVQEYTNKDDSYIVSSLSTAKRDGYTLRGWYREQDATYQLNENGSYIKLDVNEGNGIYTLNDQGNFVIKYNLDDEGEYVYITIEDAPLTAMPSLPYVFYENTNGYGLYIYDDNDVNHRTAYENLENRFTLKEIQDYIGSTSTYYVYEYLEDIFADLDQEYPESEETYNKYKNILAKANRYNRVIVEYTEADTGLDRYSLNTGYIEVDAMMEERKNGNYVYQGNQYVLYDSKDADHQELTRYNIADRFLFTPTGAIDSPSKMDKYDISIDYWDFEVDRINEDTILRAHWVKKCTVLFTWINSGGNYETRSITAKIGEQSKTIDYANGEPIGRLETLPTRNGWTFIGWSKSETEFIPWDFDKDVFPMGTDTMTLFGYMIFGSYKVVSTAEDLRLVATNPTGNYVLVNDIDLGGQVFTNTTPLGFSFAKDNSVPSFKGEFIGNGFAIKNFTMVVENNNARFDAKKVLALFPKTENAKIADLKVEDVILKIDNTSANPSDLGIAALVGEAVGTTVIDNVSVDITYQVVDGSKLLNVNVYVGDIVALGNEHCQIDAATTSVYEGDDSIESVVVPANLHWQLLH